MAPPDRPRFPGGGRYHRLAPALAARFGEPVRRVILRAGFGCPNRDGRLGATGCAFCSAAALVPRGGPPAEAPLEAQLEHGLARNLRRGARLGLSYFQDGTATDAPPARLRDLYERALAPDRVVGLSVGTRPDCLPPEVIALLAEVGQRRGKPVWLDLGLQVADDGLLASVQRGHDVACFEDAVRRARRAGLEVVAHVILDLPGAEERHREATAACLARLGVEGVKVHNLHVLEGTPLAARLRAGEIRLSTEAQFVEMAARFLEALPPSTVIHRLTGEGPEELMLGPAWWRRKSLIIRMIEEELAARDSFQGALTGALPLRS